MKRICHVTSVHGRYDPRILLKQCISLQKAGYDVTLIVEDENENEHYGGVKIVSTGKKSRNRLERFVLARKRIFRLMKKVNAEVYHFHDPELMPLATKMKKEFNKTIIFDFHENTETEILEKSWLPRSSRVLVSRLFSIFQKKAAVNYNALVTVTPSIMEKLSSINTNTVMVTNYPLIKSSEYERTDRSTLCFAGGVSAQWNHENIIRALEQVEGVTYRLFGWGTPQYLNFLKSLPGWRKVDYRGRVSHEEVKIQYYHAFIGMALNSAKQVEGEGTLGNTKLFEYMEAGLPVICSDYRLWREIVEKHDCGIIVDPKNTAQIAEAIQTLVKNPEQAIRMGQNGRNAVLKHYNWGTQEKILLDLYHSLLYE